MRKKYDKVFKAKIAIEAIRGEKTIQEISSLYEVHPNLVGRWKSELLEKAVMIFDKTGKEAASAVEAEKKEDELYRQVGKLQIENEYLKKTYRKLYGSEAVL